MEPPQPYPDLREPPRAGVASGGVAWHPRGAEGGASWRDQRHPRFDRESQWLDRLRARSASKGREAAPMLDTHTPQSGHHDGVKRPRSASARRLYNRVLLGLIVPGRYYFITWTTTPDGKSISDYWPALRKWLKRYRPGATWAYCLTAEGRGRGVCHMVLRLGPSEGRPEVKDLRAHWQGLTGANQLRIERVARPWKLANYMSDQRRGKRMAGEMSFQDDLIRWRWSKGWLPKGFTRAYARWFFRHASDQNRDEVARDWVRACHADPEQVFNPPGGGGSMGGGVPPRGTSTPERNL